MHRCHTLISHETPVALGGLSVFQFTQLEAAAHFLERAWHLGALTGVVSVVCNNSLSDGTTLFKAVRLTLAVS